jgi:hypothetical protein
MKVRVRLDEGLGKLREVWIKLSLGQAKVNSSKKEGEIGRIYTHLVFPLPMYTPFFVPYIFVTPVFLLLE